jgi:hypothetical protein
LMMRSGTRRAASRLPQAPRCRSSSCRRQRDAGWTWSSTRVCSAGEMLPGTRTARRSMRRGLRQMPSKTLASKLGVSRTFMSS